MYRPSRREFLSAVAAGLASSTGIFGQAATLFRFPHVQNVTRTRATIQWTTRQSGTGVVEYWSDSNETAKVTAETKAYLPDETGMPGAYYRHEAVLTKLEPGAYYRYQVFIDGKELAGVPGGFRTPGTQPFDFLTFGDSGTGSLEQRQIARRMLEHDARFIVHTGDLVYPSGTFERYETLYFEYYRDLMRDTPFFPCPGNHDYYDTRCLPYRAVHSLPRDRVAEKDYGRYYSFDWGNAHFISLDSNETLFDAVSGTGAMLTWLENDLQQTNKFWRIVFLHHPAYSVGKHAQEIEPQLIREYIAPILDKYSVPLVMNGHEHSYQRSAPIRGGQVVNPGEGTVYITSGGGGAQLHPVSSAGFVEIAVSEHHYLWCGANGARIRIRALRPNGTELDSTVLAPKPVLTSEGVVDAASYGPKLAAGGLVSVFGYHFSPDEVTPLRYPLPNQAAGTVVLLDGEPLPILMGSANQMNVQLPFDEVGGATLTIRTPNGSASCSVSIDPVAPALFADAIFHSDGRQVSAELPARSGETISLYLTGLGAVSGEAVAGEAARRLPAVVPVRVRIGDSMAGTEFAGLAEGVAGVYIVTFRVPRISDHVASLAVIAGGIVSNSITLPVASETEGVLHIGEPVARRAPDHSILLQQHGAGKSGRRSSV